MAAPHIFDQRDDDGIVQLLQDAPDGSEHDAVRQAVLLCPSEAITAITLPSDLSS